MRYLLAMLLALSTLVEPLWACPPVKMTFQGTAFANRAFQVVGERIYFFQGTKREISFLYSQKLSRWCYASSSDLGSAPRTACFRRVVQDGKAKVLAGRSLLNRFVLYDPHARPVGLVSVVNSLLTVKFLDSRGKSNGKRVVFRETVEKTGGHELEVRGWNCPNSRFLSCVGAHLKKTSDAEVVSEAGVLRAADLAKRMGHYDANCSGVYEK